jgi:hypothetical protein
MEASPSTSRRAPKPNAALPVRGAGCGWEIATELDLRTLRDAAGGTRIEVIPNQDTAPDGSVIAEWYARPGNPFHGRLLEDGDRLAFWASDAGWYLVDAEAGRIAVPSDGSSMTLTAEIRLFGVPSSLLALHRGDVAVHAACVEIGSRSVLLAGPSRHGKTTLAAAFAAAGHRVLTEDMTRCAMGSLPAVYPGPAAMRLRSDTADALQNRDGAEVVAEGDRLFVIAAPEARGDGAAVPLAGVVFLRDGGEVPVLEEARAATAIPDLWALTFTLPTTASRAAAFDRLTTLARTVPALNLRRELRFDTLPRVVELVEEFVARGATS